ncbi:MAG: hypothetical protein R2715_01465 [Ilumatobacteraceae bacterium]
MSNFQASAGVQGRQFAEQCDQLLAASGFELGSCRMVVKECGIEIDRVATTPTGREIWFEYKGSIQGNRPGLIRTDTLKKAIANGALLQGVPGAAPYVVLTSHLPDTGVGVDMLRSARALGYFHDVICIYQPSQTRRLREL